MTISKRVVSFSLSLAAIAIARSTAVAQYATGFENVNASQSGVPLTGQDAFQIPAGTTSVGYNAYRYLGNLLNIPGNPHGEGNFVAGTGPGSSVMARAERDVPYGCARGRWTAACDLLARFDGALPAAQNIGSFSLQPSQTAAAFIALARWQDPNAATAWNADYVSLDAAGTQLTGPVPDPAFQGLAVNQWYRWETDFDFTTNQIVELRLFESGTDNAWTHRPVGWYLRGGAAGGAPTPTAFRLFAGSTVNGNLTAFDNVALFPDPGATRVLYGCNVNPPGSLTVMRGRAVTGGMIDIGIDNPLGTQAAGSLAFLGLGHTLDPAFPCGTRIPGFGMAAPGADGELMLGNVLDVRLGTPWTGPGNRSRVSIGIPANCNLVGLKVYCQGIILDPRPAALVPIGLTSALEICIGEDPADLILLENLSLANPNAYSRALGDAALAGAILPNTALNDVLTFLVQRLFVGQPGNLTLQPQFLTLFQQMQAPGFDYINWADSFQSPVPGDPDHLVVPAALLQLEAACQGIEQQPLQGGVPAGGGNVAFMMGGKTKPEALGCEDDRHVEVMNQLSRARFICDAAATALGGILGVWSFGIGASVGVLALAACETAYANAATAEQKAHTRNKNEIRRKYDGC